MTDVKSPDWPDGFPAEVRSGSPPGDLFGNSPCASLVGQIRCYEISTCGVVEKLLADKDLSYVFNESDIGRLSKQLVLYHFSNGVCVVNSDSYFR